MIDHILALARACINVHSYRHDHDSQSRTKHVGHNKMTDVATAIDIVILVTGIYTHAYVHGMLSINIEPKYDHVSHQSMRGRLRQPKQQNSTGYRPPFQVAAALPLPLPPL